MTDTTDLKNEKAANQAADHELNVSLQNFMQWEGQVTSNRTDFQ